MPSPELQSPASWIWKPNSPLGRRPLTLALMRTLSPRCSKFTVPRTVLPLVGSRLAVAFGPPPHQPLTVSQPPSAAAAIRMATGTATCFMLVAPPGRATLPHFFAALEGAIEAPPLPFL